MQNYYCATIIRHMTYVFVYLTSQTMCIDREQVIHMANTQQNKSSRRSYFGGSDIGLN